MEDFIGVYKGLYSEEFCNRVIKQFDAIEDSGFTYTRQGTEGTTKIKKDDVSIDTAALLDEADFSSFSRAVGEEFFGVFWDNGYKSYANDFDILKGFEKHKIYVNKCQKTAIGGGYHSWHCEASSRGYSQRVLSYVLYLNDVDEGGETEFLYQRKRFKPTVGTLVIFPAHFTHTHRGNPPLSNTKYILTGWVEF
jgi:hypothetical protein